MKTSFQSPSDTAAGASAEAYASGFRARAALRDGTAAAVDDDGGFAGPRSARERNEFARIYLK